MVLGSVHVAVGARDVAARRRQLRHPLAGVQRGPVEFVVERAVPAAGEPQRGRPLAGPFDDVVAVVVVVGVVVVVVVAGTAVVVVVTGRAVVVVVGDGRRRRGVARGGRWYGSWSW